MADNSNKIREEVKSLTDRLEGGIQNLYTSEKYAAYLSTLSRFHSYSFRNIVLIHMQMPNATHVAGFSRWKKEFERHVVKGQKGIRILAPSPYILKKEMDKLDPDTGAPLFDKEGKPVIEEVDITIPAFKPVSVFDVSQTDGKALPSLAENLTGDVQQYDAFSDTLRDVSAMPIGFESLEPDTDGLCRYDSRTIAIRDGMSEVQTVSAILHEMTHAELHDYNEKIEQEVSDEQADTESAPKPRGRRAEEVEAESVSYVVCQHYGIETGENSFGYVASWSKGKELDELKASLEIIRKTAASMIERIDDRFAELCKERGIDLLSEQEPALISENEANKLVDISATEFIEQDGSTSAIDVEQQVYTNLVSEHEIVPDILPDNNIGIAERNSYGYAYPDILPMLTERALELYDQDHTVYLLYPDGTEAMAFDREEIENHDGIFGIEVAEWQNTLEFEALKSSLQVNEASKEASFIHGKESTYAIYQLKEGDELRDYRFEALNQLESHGLFVDHNNYNLSYSAPLSATDTLDSLYEKFNLVQPMDFTGHSLSMSDIIVIQKDGSTTAHYVDQLGFQELPDFLPKEQQQESVQETYSQVGNISEEHTTLTVAELESQVEAGQQISLHDLAKAIKNEQSDSPRSSPTLKNRKQTAKPSILAQLQENKKAASQEQSPSNSAPKRDSELEV